MSAILSQKQHLQSVIDKRAEERGRYLTPSEQLFNFRKAMLEDERTEYREIENARLDAMALWALADMSIPADTREFGKRHSIPELTQEIWRSAFIAGWRAALRESPERLDSEGRG